MNETVESWRVTTRQKICGVPERCSADALDEQVPDWLSGAWQLAG